MMYASLIIPTYNEAQNLPTLFKEIFQYIDRTRIDLEIIIVDDNSPDGTAAVAEKLAAVYPVKVIKRSGKMGLGSAVISGFEYSRRSWLGVMDADLSHSPKLLPELITALARCEVVIASRFAQGSAVVNWQWYRESISRIGVYLAQRLTRASDPLSGYFFIRRSVIEQADLSTTGYKILLEILVKGKFHSFLEFPFTFRPRKHGTSKLSTGEYLHFLKQLIEYSGFKLKMWLKNRPIFRRP